MNEKFATEVLTDFRPNSHRCLARPEALAEITEVRLLVKQMRNKVVLWSMIVVVVVLGCLAIYFFGPEQIREPSDITFEDETSGMTFEDKPEARALYEKMIETMRKAGAT